MDRVLIDTDVLLDVFLEREPYVENSAHILTLCESGEIEGYITPVICSNLYYLLRRSADHNKVTKKLMSLMTIVNILPMNQSIVASALNSDFTYFEDALQNFSAEESKSVSHIITRNIKDFKKSSLPVFTPSQYLTFK